MPLSNVQMLVFLKYLFFLSLSFLVYHFRNFSDDNSFFMYKKQPLLSTSPCTFSPIILIENVIQSTYKVT